MSKRMGLALAVLMLILALASPGAAHHAHGSPNYNGAILHAGDGYYETYCVQSLDDYMTTADAQWRIDNTLWRDNTSTDWDLLGQQSDGKYKINWWVQGTCDSQTNLNNVAVRFWVSTSPPSCDGYSCVANIEPFYDYTAKHYVSRYSQVYFKGEHLKKPNTPPFPNEDWRHVINHEVGHVLGLMDPTENTCDPKVNGVVPASVMHPPYDPYYCKNGTTPVVKQMWPTSLDHSKVDQIVRDQLYPDQNP